MNTAMIWGAGGGIGLALTRQLIDQGWSVVAITHHPQTELENLTEFIIEADVTVPYDVEVAVTAASQLVDEVDLWVYAIGDITMAKAEDMEVSDWQRILGANLSGAFLATQFSLPLLAEKSHLFYLGAVSERLRLPGLSAYAAAKAGLEAFVAAISKEQRRHRVSIVRPGAVQTAFWDKVPMRLPETAQLPDDLAAHILEAYNSGHKGVLESTQK
jgi:NAD(P)-dependent dehydrogenase (short-subunit alcohol dehydrogenase family)